MASTDEPRSDRHLPDQFRPQPLLGGGTGGAPCGSGPRLCRPDCRPPGRDEVVAEHPRHFGRDRTIYDPWHYLPVLVRKPGALRNGAPFKDWVCRPAMERVRRKLAVAEMKPIGRFVDVLTAVVDQWPGGRRGGLYRSDSTQARPSAEVVLNILAQRRPTRRPDQPLRLWLISAQASPRRRCARL